MSQDVLDHVFDHKTITDKSSTSHGFGLMNCKGIIEKYRKISQIFSVCLLQAESEQGRGSRFYFRLPKGIQRLVLLALLSMVNGPLELCSLAANGMQEWSMAQSALDRAHVFADSAYFSNINGTYARTLQFADSCRYYLNAHYIRQCPDGRLLMTRLATCPSCLLRYNGTTTLCLPIIR